MDPNGCPQCGARLFANKTCRCGWPKANALKPRVRMTASTFLAGTTCNSLTSGSPVSVGQPNWSNHRQSLYEERRARAIRQLGRRGGIRTLVHRQQDGTLERHMARMTAMSRWVRKRRKQRRDRLKPFLLTRDWICFRCQHRWKSRQEMAPNRCPSCFARAWNRPRNKPGRKRKWLHTRP